MHYFSLHAKWQICASVTDVINKKASVFVHINKQQNSHLFAHYLSLFFAFFSTILHTTQSDKYVSSSLTSWTKKIVCLSLNTNSTTLIFLLLIYHSFFAFFCAIFHSTQSDKCVPSSLTWWTKKLVCLSLNTNSTALICLLHTYPSFLPFFSAIFLPTPSDKYY